MGRARSGGSFRFVSSRDGEEYAFRGCFHEIRPDRIVQTFTYEGDPDGVALETLWFSDLGDGRTQLRTQSLVDSFEGRDAWLRSGMEVGVNEGYATLFAIDQVVTVNTFGPGAGAGWELFLYACGFGLCAYSAVDRAPGPGWIGVAVLAVTTVVAAGGKSTLLGWPLVLGAGAAALLVVGLRPSRPLPPAPSRGEAAQVFEIRDER